MEQLKRLLVIPAFLFFILSSAIGQGFLGEYKLDQTSGFIDFAFDDGGNIYALSNKNDASVELLKISSDGKELERLFLFEGYGLVISFLNGEIFVGGKGRDNFNDALLVNVNPENFQINWSKTFPGDCISAIALIYDKIMLGSGSRVGDYCVLYTINKEGDILSEIKVTTNYYTTFTHLFESGDNKITYAGFAKTVSVGFEGCIWGEIDLNTGENNIQGSINEAFTLFFDNFFLPRPFGFDINSKKEKVVAVADDRMSRSGLRGGGLAFFDKDGNAADTVSFNFIYYSIYPFDAKWLNDSLVIVTGSFVVRNEPAKVYVGCYHKNGSLVWESKNESGYFARVKIKDDYLLLSGSTGNPEYQLNVGDSYLVKMEQNGDFYPFNVSVSTFLDVNKNCKKEQGEPEISEGFFLKFKDQIFKPEANKDFNLNLPKGSHKIEVVGTNGIVPCQDRFYVTLNENRTYLEQEILFKKENCRELLIGMTQSNIPACETRRNVVQFSNQGTLTESNIKVRIGTGKWLSIIDAEFPFSTINNQAEFIFPDTILPGEVQTFWVDFKSDCQADLFSAGEVSVAISPKVTCNQGLYSEFGSLIDVDGYCDGQKTILQIINKKNYPVKNLPYRVLLNLTELERGEIDLEPNEGRSFEYNSGGNNLTMEVETPDDVYGDIFKQTTIEGCELGPNRNYLKGYKGMRGAKPSFPWEYNSQVIFQKEYSTNRIELLHQGLGYYHFAENTDDVFEFKIEFENLSGRDLANPTVELSLHPSYDANSFIILAGNLKNKRPISIGNQISLELEQSIPEGATYLATFSIKGLPNQNAREKLIEANLIAADGTVFPLRFGFVGYFEDLELTPPFPDFFIPSTNTFGMAGLDNRPYAICLTDEGDILQGTQSRSFLGENSSHFSFVDASGFVKWEKQFQVDGRFIMPEKAVFDEGEGMFWIFGFTIAEDRSTTNVFIQVDLNGEMLFEKRFNEVSEIPFSAKIIDVFPSISGEILLLVDVLDPDENYAKMLAFDKDGKVIREKIISDLRVDVDNLTVIKVKEDKHGNIFILYTLRNVPTMLKLDSDWNTQFINTYRRSTSGESYNPNHFTILENGEISLMGDFYKTFGLNSFLYHPELVHFNSEFELKEEIPIDFEPYNGYVTGFAAIDSTFYISGFFEKDSSYRSQVYWMSVDYDGNIREKKERDAFGASLRSEEMVNDNEGNFVINYFNYPIRVVAWTHTGFWKINEGISSLGPSNFVDNLMPIVYPNPAKDKIFFKGIQPEKIKIFSSDGRVLIETTFDTEGLDVGDLNAGNYYILLFLNGQKYIRQFSKI